MQFFCISPSCRQQKSPVASQTFPSGGFFLICDQDIPSFLPELERDKALFYPLFSPSYFPSNKQIYPDSPILHPYFPQQWFMECYEKIHNVSYSLQGGNTLGDIRGMHGESLQELLAKNVDKYFEAFMTTYHPAMMRYVQSRFHANFPDDEEAVEEAFVRVYRRFMGLNEQEILRLHIEPYLRETVHNCFLSQQDKKLRGSNEFSLELIEEQGFELAETQHIDGPEIAYLKQERQRELILLLQNLKPVISGNIIYARYFLGFSIKKLSFTFGLSENTINSILRRSLRKLREIKEIRQMKEMR